MAAVAANKGIEPQALGVQIRRQTVEGTRWQTAFFIAVDLGPGLSRREQAILFNSARHCEAYKLLTGEMTFDYHLANGLCS
jgi:hypothetical protein